MKTKHFLNRKIGIDGCSVTVGVNQFVLKNKERKKNHRIAQKSLQLYEHRALDLNQRVWCVGVFCVAACRLF